MNFEIWKQKMGKGTNLKFLIKATLGNFEWGQFETTYLTEL